MRKGTSVLATLILFALASAPTFAAADPASPAQLFADANQAYQKGEFESAEMAYRKLVDAGVDSGTVYYNLGNACFKQKRLGEAIYYWQKARRRMPGDRDVRENLDLANLMIVDRIEIPSPPFPVRVLSRFAGLLSATEESWLVLILFSAANILAGAYVLARNWRVAIRLLVGVVVTTTLFAVFGASLAWKIYRESSTREGIVVEAKADIRSGPGNDNVTVFTVHEGIQLQVRGSAGAWYQVTLPNGWSGWVQSQAVRIL
jgi:tetratricopeptide (TPR) repeat protein